MPFTPAHPAAILPVARVLPRLPFSALAIGSMAPDFPYFLLAQSSFHRFGHTAPGIFAFDIPAGFAVYAVWNVILKAPMAALLPAAHRRRLAPLAIRPARFGLADILAVVFALLLGTLTHIGWDAFTHGSGWVVRHIPILSAPLLPREFPLVHRFPLYNFLQHCSTVIGLSVLAVAYVHWYRAAPEAPANLLRPVPVRTRHTLAAAILITSPVIGIAYSYIARHLPGAVDFPKKRLADGVEAAMTTGTLILLGFAIRQRILDKDRDSMRTESLTAPKEP